MKKPSLLIVFMICGLFSWAQIPFNFHTPITPSFLYSSESAPNDHTGIDYMFAGTDDFRAMVEEDHNKVELFFEGSLRNNVIGVAPGMFPGGNAYNIPMLDPDVIVAEVGGGMYAVVVYHTLVGTQYEVHAQLFEWLPVSGGYYEPGFNVPFSNGPITNSSGITSCILNDPQHGITPPIDPNYKSRVVLESVATPVVSNPNIDATDDGKIVVTWSSSGGQIKAQTLVITPRSGGVCHNDFFAPDLQKITPPDFIVDAGCSNGGQFPDVSIIDDGSTNPFVVFTYQSGNDIIVKQAPFGTVTGGGAFSGCSSSPAEYFVWTLPGGISPDSPPRVAGEKTQMSASHDCSIAVAAQDNNIHTLTWNGGPSYVPHVITKELNDPDTHFSVNDNPVVDFAANIPVYSWEYANTHWYHTNSPNPGPDYWNDNSIHIMNRITLPDGDPATPPSINYSIVDDNFSSNPDYPNSEAITPSIAIAVGTHDAAFLYSVPDAILIGLHHKRSNNLNGSLKRGTEPQVLEGDLEEVEFMMYPNPASDLVTIQIGNELPEGTSLRIINAMGQVMQTLIPVTTEVSVDVSSLTSGMYVVEYRDAEGTLQRKQLIVH